VTWLPFDLHPEYPPEGIPRSQLHARYGEAFHERLQQTFAASGLVYNPPPEIVPNTMRALRVTELARERSLHKHVHDRLMRAYWEEARNIGDRSELLTLVVEAGLDEAQAGVVIEGDAYHDRVLGSTAQAQSLGITGIPAFLLDRRLLVLGAQPREVFEQALQQLEGQGREAPHVEGTTDATG
jgi:predicted DsbA family dithiol-disulfide isomerase